MYKFLCIAGILFAAGIGLQAAASENAAIVLTISGNTGSGTPRDFTIADIEALGSEKITTTTPWDEGTVTYEGVPLAKLMQHVGAQGTTTVFLALNNYSTAIPMADFSQYGTILAVKRNGQYMDVKDKGPLFVVYPFDDYPDLKNDLYYSRSAWQVRNIEVE